MVKKIDLTNKRFGRLKALKPTNQRDKSGNIIWMCVCDCGKKINVASHDLIRSNTTSCGCKWSDNGIRIRKVLDDATIEGITVPQILSKTPVTNTTGVKGVSIQTRKNGKQYYRAYITVNGKQISLGLHHTLEAAKKARQEAEKKYWGEAIEQYKLKLEDKNEK